MLKKYMDEKRFDYMYRNLAVIELKNGLYDLEIGYVSGNYSEINNNRKKLILEIIEGIFYYLRSYEGKRNTKNILLYIRIPTRTNIIPILEQFKEIGVTPCIEPIIGEDRKQNLNY